jgi:hypothetical protein
VEVWPIRRNVITRSSTTLPAQSEVHFLEYRLDAISRWPPSARKQAVAEAISLRLASIARSAIGRDGLMELMANSCRLLDVVFLGNPETLERPKEGD